MAEDQTPDEQRFEDLRKRQRFIPPPPRIAEMCLSARTRTGYARCKSAISLESGWSEAAGPLATATRAGNIRRGVLDVICKNSAVMQELTFQKQMVINQLNQKLEGQTVKDLKLRVVDF